MAEGRKLSMEEELQWAEKQHKLDAAIIARLEDENTNLLDRIDLLEDRIRELRTILQEQAVAAGHTVEEFRAAMDADYAAHGRPPIDWSDA